MTSGTPDATSIWPTTINEFRRTITARCYLIDMPRAMNKERLYGLFSAVESIKDGFAYDDRYHYKEKLFDCPNIWMFTNVEPDMGMLSRDRWRFYEVKDNELCSV